MIESFTCHYKNKIVLNCTVFKDLKRQTTAARKIRSLLKGVGCLPGGGACTRGRCLPKGCLPRECLTRHLPMNRITDRCKNFTFRQLLLQMVITIQCSGIQDFPEVGAPTLSGWGEGVAPTYDFAKFPQKLHEIERIWNPLRCANVMADPEFGAKTYYLARFLLKTA